MSNRTFWKTVKSFLTNKGCMTNDCINFEKDGDIVRDERALVELFNENYKNIADISSGKEPSSLRSCEDSAQDRSAPLLTKLYQNIFLITVFKKLKRNFF